MKVDDELAERLAEYVDDRLDDAARRGVEAALEGEELAAVVAGARATRSLLAGLEAEEPPADFAFKVRRRLGRRASLRSRAGHRDLLGARVSAESFALVALVAMLACYLFFQLSREVGPLEELPPPPSAPGAD